MCISTDAQESPYYVAVLVMTYNTANWWSHYWRSALAYSVFSLNLLTWAAILYFGFAKLEIDVPHFRKLFRGNGNWFKSGVFDWKIVADTLIHHKNPSLGRKDVLLQLWEWCKWMALPSRQQGLCCLKTIVLSSLGSYFRNSLHPIVNSRNIDMRHSRAAGTISHSFLL